MRRMVADAGLSDRIAVDSAGTGPWHVGEAAHPGTLNILRRHNITHRGRARQLRGSDFADFDYLLAMDSGHLRVLQRDGDQREGVTVAKFLSFANAAGTVRETDVPDPYYNDTFDVVYSLVERGCTALLAHIRATHQI